LVVGRVRQSHEDKNFGVVYVTAPDFILWMQSKMCLCYNGGTVGNLKTFLEMSGSIQKYIPLTAALISSLK